MVCKLEFLLVVVSPIEHCFHNDKCNAKCLLLVNNIVSCHVLHNYVSSPNIGTMKNQVFHRLLEPLNFLVMHSHTVMFFERN